MIAVDYKVVTSFLDMFVAQNRANIVQISYTALEIIWVPLQPGRFGFPKDFDPLAARTKAPPVEYSAFFKLLNIPKGRATPHSQNVPPLILHRSCNAIALTRNYLCLGINWEFGPAKNRIFIDRTSKSLPGAILQAAPAASK